MEVIVLKYPTEEDWALAKTAALNTVSKKMVNHPTSDWKEKLIKANHSPARVLQFYFRLVDIPYYVSTHLARHVHATPFISSQRNDRQAKYDRELAPQNTPVTMDWFMNIEELITIAHKRLCFQADKTTREWVRAICDKAIEYCPELKSRLVPLCVYRNGLCDEFNPCGYNETYKITGWETK